jgi:carbohydrate kinase (thermoresistant glucokinase family)
MGVSGSGKSTIGAALGQRLRVPFADTDDFHPAANVAKMTAGHALDDNDRFPWLEAIGEWLASHQRWRRDELFGAQAHVPGSAAQPLRNSRIPAS